MEAAGWRLKCLFWEMEKDQGEAGTGGHPSEGTPCRIWLIQHIIWQMLALTDTAFPYFGEHYVQMLARPCCLKEVQPKAAWGQNGEPW